MILPENPYQFEKRNGMLFNLNKTWQEGSQATAKAIVKWLEEPCREHYSERVKKMWDVKAREKFFTPHRKDCTECWNELKRELEQER